MEELVKILIERDVITREEAVEKLEEVRKLCLNWPDYAEEIFEDELGLEPDYIGVMFG